MTTCGWLWLYLGAFLMLAEVLTPGFILFFFGLSAATVGAMKFAIGDPFTANWQMLAFSVLSVAYLYFLRRKMKKIFVGKSETSRSDFENESVGRLGKVTEEICPPLTGRVMIGDAEWTAESTVEIPVGADVKVVAQRNLTMKVEPAPRA